MSYESTVLARSPALYIPANNGTLTDASGNGHDASSSSPHISLAGSNGALSGDTAIRWLAGAGSSDTIVLASPATVPYVAPYTVEFWCKFENSGGEFDELKFELTLPSGHPSGAGWLRVFAQETPDPSVGLYAWINDSGAATLHEFSAGPLADHPFCWHHYVFTYNGTTLRYYQDGAVQRILVEAAGMFSSTQVPSAASLYVDGPMSVPLSVNHIAVYPTQLSDADVLANYSAATPRQDAGCFGLPIRLRHSSGHVVFASTDEVTSLRAMDQDVLTHDGVTMSVYSGGVPKLQVPIPPAPEPPTRWVGVDPGGGLTVHDILPTPATHGLAPLVPPVPVVTTGLTCDQLRCGAASNMRLHLEELYNNWATVLGGAVKLGEILGAVAAIAALGELVVGAAILGEFAEEVFASIKPNLQAWIGTIVPNPFPTITIPGDTMIWNGAYCQLTCNGNVVDPTSVQVQAWNTYITNNSSALVGPSLQLALLNALLDFTPLLDWQTAASTAVANPGCAGFSCP